MRPLLRRDGLHRDTARREVLREMDRLCALLGLDEV